MVYSDVDRVPLGASYASIKLKLVWIRCELIATKFGLASTMLRFAPIGLERIQAGRYQMCAPNSPTPLRTACVSCATPPIDCCTRTTEFGPPSVAVSNPPSPSDLEKTPPPTRRGHQTLDRPPPLTKLPAHLAQRICQKGLLSATTEAECVRALRDGRRGGFVESPTTRCHLDIRRVLNGLLQFDAILVQRPEQNTLGSVVARASSAHRADGTKHRQNVSAPSKPRMLSAAGAHRRLECQPRRPLRRGRHRRRYCERRACRVPPQRRPAALRRGICCQHRRRRVVEVAAVACRARR